MPAQSKQQQKLFGLALAVKRGDVPKSDVSDEIKDIVKKMSEKDIEKFASTKHKGLPLKKEELSENVSAEELIDVIDLDPSNKLYDKYKKMLKDLHGIDYVEPKIRYKKETKLIKKYDNTKFSAKTKKGININVIVEKVPNLDRSLRITIYDESGDSIGGAGFGIDITNKKIRIGGAFVKPNMRRKGVYSIIADYIQKIAKENKLKIVDSGRSADAIAFWKNRMESLINKIDEKWSDKYKRSIDCNNPKGFSQRAHCQGKKKRK